MSEIIKFGKYKKDNLTYQQVAKKDPNYFNWILKTDFNESIKVKVRLAMGFKTVKENPYKQQTVLPKTLGQLIIQKYLKKEISSVEMTEEYQKYLKSTR